MDQPIHERAAAPLRLDARRLIVLGLLAAATIALLLTLGDGQSTLSTLAQAHWHWLVLAALIHYGGFALRGHRWQLLLGTLGYRLGYLYTTGLLLAGWFVSALLPARAGDAFRVFALRMPPATQPAVPVAPALGTIVLERALDILAILLLSAGFSMGVLQGRVPGWLLGVYATALVLVLILGGILLATPLLLERLRPLSARPLWHKALEFITQIAGTLHQLAQHPGVAVVAIGESLLIWLCDGLLLWLVVLSLGQPFTLGSAGFVALTVDIFAAVPLTPGGMGQIETAYAALLALIAHPGLHIPAVVLATRAISYWSFLILSGLVTLLAGFGRVLRRRVERC
ncbi:MAG: flippase-like domain-containing protein [Caldilineaceae bacterium]|nr:flippase-like domain-containing protein [Caldilineaceae bacterium]